MHRHGLYSLFCFFPPLCQYFMDMWPISDRVHNLLKALFTNNLFQVELLLCVSVRTDTCCHCFRTNVLFCDLKYIAVLSNIDDQSL